MTDPTQVFLFVGDADAPRIVECGGDIGNVSMPSQYYDVFSQVFGQNVSNGSASCDWSGVTEQDGDEASDADKKIIARILTGDKDKRNCTLSWRCVYMLNLAAVYNQWVSNEELWNNTTTATPITDKDFNNYYRLATDADTMAI